MNCSELMQGQRLFCEVCGFELEVANACEENCCSTDVCCNGDVQCCGAPMELR